MISRSNPGWRPQAAASGPITRTVVAQYGRQYNSRLPASGVKNRALLGFPPLDPGDRHADVVRQILHVT